MKIRLVLVILFTLAQVNPSYGLSAPQVAEDRDSGYNRDFFKHWIDADKNGCDTRAEVLISEAVVKPKVDKKCKISGGKWLSSYDNKSVTNASQLDVDHLVPLAEAWRSGAWAWTPKQRQDFANDLSDKRALIAVTLSTNRSKGDKDISEWVPKVDTCGYVKNWIAIKIRYSLTYDSKEAKSLSDYFENCKFGDIPVQGLSGYSYQSQAVTPTSDPVALGESIGSIGDYSNKTVQYLNYFKETHPNFKGVINYTVEDPPIGFLTEDINNNCKIINITYTTDIGKTVFEYSTLDVFVRCRWVKAESVSGSAWKWRAGTSSKALDPAVCGKLIEVDIEGFKALVCAPADPSPSESKSSSTTGNKQCWVNGYTTKKGTSVKGYYRAC